MAFLSGEHLVSPGLHRPHHYLLLFDALLCDRINRSHTVRLFSDPRTWLASESLLHRRTVLSHLCQRVRSWLLISPLCLAKLNFENLLFVQLNALCPTPGTRCSQQYKMNGIVTISFICSQLFVIRSRFHWNYSISYSFSMLFWWPALYPIWFSRIEKIEGPPFLEAGNTGLDSQRFSMMSASHCSVKWKITMTS